MAKLLAMFPGQGSQYVGMGKELINEFPVAKLVFEEAEDAISLQIRQLCSEGPESELQLTANTQPCILAHSIAVWRVLQSEAGILPHGFAGHSLGEYSALVAAGVLSLRDATRLVRQRGEAMQSAVPAGLGAMAAIIGADVNDLEQICEVQSKPDDLVEPVNYNSPQQVVIAGHSAAVARVCEILEQKGVKCVPLQVSAPFHSSLMTKAKVAMTPLLEATTYAQPSAPIFPNLDARPTANYNARYLIEQIDHAVRWTQTLENAAEQQFDHFAEIGPGKVLFGLARRGLPRGMGLINSENLTAAIDKIAGLNADS